MTQPIQVILVDDDDLLRESMAEVVMSDPSCELVGQAGTVAEAISLATRLQPQVVVVDVKMPDGGGARVTSEIRQKSPRTKILAFSAYGDRDTVFELLRSGASGFLLKGSSPGALLDGIHNVHAGRSPLSPSVAHEVVGRLAEELRKDTDAEDVRRVRLKRLNGAMAGQFDVAYQPIVQLADGKPVGYEALARFDGDELQAPQKWFADAAEAGLLIDFEVAIIREAFTRRPRIPGTYLSVNVSPETMLSGRLEAATAGADEWVAEITEHAPVADYETLARAFKPLKGRGVRLAVDDAGAGFASLRHILLLEPHFIKIDLSLTRGIDSNKRQRALAAALISFAAEIEASVVAEGVENAHELAVLRNLGVEFGQGYLFGRPEIGRLRTVSAEAE